MLAHHQATIDRLSAHFKSDPTVLALIIGGSVAKGLSRPDSDIDFMLVVTDEDYARRVQNNAFHFFSKDFTDYDGGYVDGKIIDRAFLRAVGVHVRTGRFFARSGDTRTRPAHPRIPGSRRQRQNPIVLRAATGVTMVRG